MRVHRGPRSRRGMTIIEVLIALVILTGALLGMGRFITGFAHTTTGGAISSTAADLVVDRVEQIKAYSPYSNLETAFNGTESGPPLPAGFTRTTTILRTVNATTDYKAVTVSVTHAALSQPVKKSTIISAF